MAKTPSYARKLIERHQEQMLYVVDILRVKRNLPLENQMDWVKEKSEEYWIGLARGFSSALEDILHNANCYAGFGHLSTTISHDQNGKQFLKPVHPNDPDYADWCVSYYVKG